MAIKTTTKAIELKTEKLTKTNLSKLASMEFSKLLAEQTYKIEYYKVKSMVLGELKKEVQKLIEDNEIDIERLEKIHTINDIIR